MPVLVKVQKNNNTKMPKCYGKYYGKTVTTHTMTYRELTQHIADHNSVYGRDVCEGVATKLQECLLEQLLEGKKVQFGDLGTFYLSVRTEGAEDEEKFNLATNVKGVYLRFLPSRKDVNDLSAKNLKRLAVLMNVKDLLGKSADDETNSGN